MKIFVETKRLILREVVLADADGFFELDADPEVHRYLGNKPVTTKEASVETIKFIRQQYLDHGIGRWAMVEKETGAFIGWTGLKFVTNVINNHQNYYDLGYRLIRKYWGKGFATESAVASLHYAFEELRLKEVFAAASCENAGSNKILKNIGLKLIESFNYMDIRCNWYRIDRNQFDHLQKKN